jgi:hypothetical protein
MCSAVNRIELLSDETAEAGREPLDNLTLTGAGPKKLDRQDAICPAWNNRHYAIHAQYGAKTIRVIGPVGYHGVSLRSQLEQDLCRRSNVGDVPSGAPQ